MAGDGSSKQPRVTPAAPPRTLNVQNFAESRAPELESLHSIVTNRLNNDFRSQRNKRRRTTGYDNRVGKKKKHRKRQKLGGTGSANSEAAEEEKKVPRRIRRRAELKKNPDTGFSITGDETKRLRTHIWHAKRFTMTKLWGFYLPLGLQGRGRGSRAILKKLINGVLMHDASYHGAVQLEGPQSSLLEMLSRVFVPSQMSLEEDISNSVLSGDTSGNAMLHHVGVPFSPAIAPVTYMWRPCNRQNIATTDNNNSDGVQDKRGSSFRQLWVWIHACSFSEGCDALRLACQKQMEETGSSIDCISLHGKLAKLEVIGPKTFQLFQKIFRPLTSITGNSVQLAKCSDVENDKDRRVEKRSVLDNEDEFSSSGIISLTVADPRVVPKKKFEIVPPASLTGKSDRIRRDEEKSLSDFEDIQSADMESLPSSVRLAEDCELIENVDLWNVRKQALPPLEENVVCTEKHKQQLAFFCLGKKDSGQLASTGDLCSKSCPIILINDGKSKASTVRWSVILPLSWIKVFWISFVSGGAFAIGLREKHWIAGDVGLPYFPSDFPDCNAYNCFMATEAATLDEKMNLRPAALRPADVPMPPPWESVKISLAKAYSGGGEDKTLCAVDRINKEGDMEAYSYDAGKFVWLVARTADKLSDFLGGHRSDHQLLLFPKIPSTRIMSKFMKEEGWLKPCSNQASTLVNNGEISCFVRVILHAYRRGVFEEGAVVCAPRHSDVAVWTSSSEDNKDELQMHPSSMKSYFEQQPSGKWELQVPKDPLARESHRWPIGFVTTGFVRGSKKPAAQAVCEVNLLAQLREEQWGAVPVKRRRKEVYVLVRNLRSTAYRLALATIVLEQHEDDLDFM